MRVVELTAVVLIAVSGTAIAEDAPRPMTEQEFAARVTGKTFFFSQSGHSLQPTLLPRFDRSVDCDAFHAIGASR